MTRWEIMLRMPLVHMVATTVLVVLCLRAFISTSRLRRGQARPRAAAEYVAMVVLCGLVAWQASMWIGADHPEATTAFRAAVWAQLLLSTTIAGLNIASLWLRGRGPSKV